MTEHPPRAATRVLFVADNSAHSDTLRQQLLRLGYLPLGPAVCCEQALDMARLDPGIILLDAALSRGPSALETASLLRECLGLPVIFLAERIDRDFLDQIGTVEASGCLLVPVRDADLLASLEVATHHVQREHHLLTRERWMATSFDSLEEALLAIDATELVRFVNPMAQKLLGLEQEAILGHFLGHLYHMQYETRPSEASPGRVEGLLTRGDGRVIPVEETRSWILDKGGGHDGTMVVLRDISQRRRHEASLRQSLDNLQRVLEQTVNALAVTSEQRDPFTAGHQQRVSRLASAIAREMSLSAQVQEGVRMAGLVHDIGKISVPSEILAKSGPLTALEMRIVRQHSEVGYQILKEVAFPWPVARMVLEHHERQDGSGYPAGLSGDAILPEARILAVADVVEAMTAHRPYRPAFRLDQALDEIQSRRGTHYDPEVADACLAACRNGDCLSG
jgi:putative nucleotidyltransferase with HDIG domain/PAS domain S-box-containing protein